MVLVICYIFSQICFWQKIWGNLRIIYFGMRAKNKHNLIVVLNICCLQTVLKGVRQTQPKIADYAVSSKITQYKG